MSSSSTVVFGAESEEVLDVIRGCPADGFQEAQAELQRHWYVLV